MNFHVVLINKGGQYFFGSIGSICCDINDFAGSFVSFEISAAIGWLEARQRIAAGVTLATARSVIKLKYKLHQVPGQLYTCKTAQPGREGAYTQLL